MHLNITAQVVVTSFPQVWANDGVVQAIPLPPNQPPSDDDLFLVKRRLLIDYYNKKQLLVNLEERMEKMKQDNEEERKRLNGVIASLREDIDELKKKDVEHDAMMRVAELVRLIDRHVSREMYRDSELVTINDVLRAKRVTGFDRDQQRLFDQVVSSFNLQDKRMIRSITALRNSIAQFRSDRNKECHKKLQKDMEKDDFYQIIDIFCESFSVRNESEMQEWKVQGRELVDIAYATLGGKPFERDAMLTRQEKQQERAQN